MAESADWDVLQLRDVPTESRTVRELAQHAAKHGFLSGVRRGANSPLLPTTVAWDDYIESLPSKRRWFLRNRLKRLSKLGRASLETVSGGDGLRNALEDGFRLEAAAWKGKAGTAIACHPELLHFYTTFAQQAAEPQRTREPKRDLGLHVRELLLDELIGGEWAPELLAVEHVLARAVPAELGATH